MEQNSLRRIGVWKPGSVDVVHPDVVPQVLDVSREQACVWTYRCVNDHFVARQVQMLIARRGGVIHENDCFAAQFGPATRDCSFDNLFLDDPNVFGRATTSRGVGQGDDILCSAGGAQ